MPFLFDPEQGERDRGRGPGRSASPYSSPKWSFVWFHGEAGSPTAPAGSLVAISVMVCHTLIAPVA